MVIAYLTCLLIGHHSPGIPGRWACWRCWHEVTWKA